MQATYVDISAGDTSIVEVTETISKTVSYTLDGPGNLVAVDNCEINSETGEITFTDPDQNASFRLEGDTGTTTVEVSMGDYVLPSSTDFVILEAHSTYDTINIQFTDAEAEARAQAEAEAKAAEEAAAAKAAAQAQATTTRSTSTYTQSSATPEATQTTTVSTSSATPATTQTATSTVSSSSTAAPASGAAQNSMTSEERAVAESIFNAYNEFRASKGLSQVAWSEDAANMAYGSAVGCAANGKLTHKLGIPVSVQGNYSDILQYASWKMSGSEAVQRWSQSDGHRKMMQCASAQVAGVAAYNNGGIWYYTIVYNFQGTNQSGS
jgi:uncharacterized protein YkwD